MRFLCGLRTEWRSQIPTANIYRLAYSIANTFRRQIRNVQHNSNLLTQLATALFRDAWTGMCVKFRRGAFLRVRQLIPESGGWN